MSEQRVPVKAYLKLRALALVREGKPEEAIPKFQQYLESNKDDDDAWASLAGAYRRLNNIPKAIETYRTAFEKNPRSTYALLNLVSLLAARHSDDDEQKLQEYIPQAKRLLMDVISKGEATHWNWYDLATLQLIDGDLPAAIRSFHYAAELTPQNAIENFKSVLNALEFLGQNNPGLPGVDQAIAIIKPYVAQAGQSST
jgi:tetratricopeptide (TPR) repeat protein